MINYQLFLLVLSFSGCLTFPDHPGSCTVPDGQMATNPKDQTNGGYEIFGLPVGSYNLGQSYSVYLNGTSKVAGFILYAMSTTEDYRIGSWTPASSHTAIVDYPNTDEPVGPCTGDTNNTIGHTSVLSSTPLFAVSIGTWTAPSTAEGSVTFQGVAVQAVTIWYNLTPAQVSGPTTTNSITSGTPLTTAVGTTTSSSSSSTSGSTSTTTSGSTSTTTSGSTSSTSGSASTTTSGSTSSSSSSTSGSTTSSTTTGSTSSSTSGSTSSSSSTAAVTSAGNRRRNYNEYITISFVTIFTILSMVCAKFW